MSKHIRLSGPSWIFFWLFAVAMFGLGFFLPSNAEAGDDWFWYAYPMPESYLYVDDPLRFSLWSANYGGRQYYTPLARSPVYVPVVRHHDRSRFRRRACEVRILSAVRSQFSLPIFP